MWLKLNGKQVKAVQFGAGKPRVPGQTQVQDRDGTHYTVRVGRDIYKLEDGDWVCVGDDGKPIDVQSQGRFLSEHINDPSIQEPEKPQAPAPVIAMTAAEREMARDKLIADAPSNVIERPNEPAVLPPTASGKGTVKRKPGRPPGAKNKPKAQEALEEL